MCGGRGRLRCGLIGVRPGCALASRAALLLFLLTCLAGQFFLLFDVMVVWFRHELSGGELWRGGPEQELQGALAAGMRADGPWLRTRHCTLFQGESEAFLTNGLQTTDQRAVAQ